MKVFRSFISCMHKLLLVSDQQRRRHRIQKEIWEDEGVIVGRSLDVFISKLRKKLDGYASIQIVNVHGKGYRLQINDTSSINRI